MLATLLVAILPLATVWALWELGVVTSRWISVPLGLALALLASFAGAEYWKRRPAAGDVLFSDLLLWGWLRRTRAEHQVDDAVELLGHNGAADEAEKLRLLERLAAALDAKDPYLDGHSHRVARFSTGMARRLGVAHEEAERIRTAAAIHDVGKLHVPPELLAKPGDLTGAEAEIVRRHADDGAVMVACLGEPAVSDIVRHHHERFDGGGYPAGLKGEAIPLGARIVAVADTFDAITSARPYRAAGTHKQALEVLDAEAGAQLDPVVVRAFARDYANRRGLLLWALLAQPVATARRHPLPAAVAVGGLVVLGAAATAVQLGGTTRRDEPAGGTRAQIAAPAAGARDPKSAQTHQAKARQAARAVAASDRATPRSILVSAVTPRATRPDPPRRATHPPGRTRPGGASDPTVAPPPRPGAAPEPTPRSPAAPRTRRISQPPATPAPHRTRSPSSPPKTTGPAVTPPPSSTPHPATPSPSSPPSPTPPPASTPQPAPSPPPAAPAKDGCKHGGYATGGYRNQGQCVSSSHGP